MLKLAKQGKLNLDQAITIEQSRRSFWKFCQTEAPDYYLEHRTHLIINCLFLEAFFYKRPCRYVSPIRHEKRIEQDVVQYEIQGDKTVFTCDLQLDDGTYPDYVIINEPPRHGKSRTLFLYTAWRYGKDVATMVMTVCHKKDLAIEFSAFTRDTIEEEKVREDEIIYNDIFPDTRLQYGNKSRGKWALDGRFHSYKGAGILAGEAGVGCNLLIADDILKGSIEAFNPDHLEKVDSSLKNNFFQRLEKGGDFINCATRWADEDPCGKALDGENGHRIKVLKMEAWAPEQGMLCDDFLTFERYKFLESELDEMIFQANYHQRPPKLKGKLYKQFLEYEELPKIKEVIFRGDTADEGDDFLCIIVAAISMLDEVYILDVYYTDEGQEITEPEAAKFLYENHIRHGFLNGMIEHNSGGGGFARAVGKILRTNIANSPKVEDAITEIGTPPTNKIDFTTFTQTENKLARIISASNFVQKHIFFPVGWRQKWPLFYKHLDQMMREGKNQKDDGPDTLTMLAEAVESRFPSYDELVKAINETQPAAIKTEHF